jgi:hypothetical protein
LIELAKNVKRETDETLEARKRSRSDGGGEDESVIPRWTFEKAYNIVKVLRVSEDPFRVFVKSRPPVAGNQKPLDYYLEPDDFASISPLKGKKATKLKKQLSSNLEHYCAANKDFPLVVIIQLKTTDWGKELADRLESLNKRK